MMITRHQCLFGIVISILAFSSLLEAAEPRITWWHMSKLLREFVSNGLRANELQDILTRDFDWDKAEVDGKALLEKINNDVSYIFESIIKFLKDVKREIEKVYDDWPEHPRDEVNKTILCCERGKDYHTDMDTGCVVLAEPATSDSWHVKAPFTPDNVIRQLVKSSSFFRTDIAHYFAFNDGSLYMYPSQPRDKISQICTKYDPRRRYFFSQSKSPEAREVVLIVDKGKNTNDTFLEEVVVRIFDALSPIDRMALCLPDGDKCRTRHISSDVDPLWPNQDYPLGTQSLLGSIVAASEKNKKRITANFNSWLRKTSSSNVKEQNTVSSFKSHAIALTSGSSLFDADLPVRSYHLAFGQYHRILVYITSKPGWEHWQNDTELTAQLNKSIENNVRVVIHPIQSASSRHWNEVILDNGNSTNNITVRITSFANPTELHSSSSSIMSFGLSEPDHPVIPMPYWDAFGMGYIMSLCVPLTKGIEFIGALCSDISIINLLEAKTNIEGIEDAYVFIVNSLGYTLMHPLLPSPHSITQDPTYVTINRLEQAEKVKPLLEKMVQQLPGSSDVEGMFVQPVGRPRGSSVPGPVRLLRRNLRYEWVPINRTDLTISLVLPLKDGKVFSSQYRCKDELTCKTGNFQYHIPRKGDDRTLCRFFGTAVTEGQGLVKFAPSCFIDVLSYIKNETEEQISKLYDIFGGAAPRDELLKRDLQASVRLLEDAENLWLEQQKEHKNLTDNIGLRFMGTSDGAFISFPGASLRQAYDHRKRPWYLRSVSNIMRDSIAMTSPYCDEFGAGMVYTITKALYDNDGKPVAVVAGDITFQYVLKHFHIQISHCKTRATCILIDRLGYVILKSDWSTINTSPTECLNNTEIKETHLNHIAPDIARDMMANQLLHRRACHDYEEDLTFYYWSFSLRGHETLHTGPNYIVYKIAQTSLYLIVRTSEFRERFCNCNPYLRGIKVECHDTCAEECECPCVGGNKTEPCHNPEADVHRYPIPACKPRGLIEIRANNCTQSDIHPCPQHDPKQCDGKNESDCSKVVFCLWRNNACQYLNDIYKDKHRVLC